jgi:protein O-mannosyl-transferase
VRERLLVAVILAAVIVSYANSVNHQFTLDDIQLYVVRNPQVTEPTWASLFQPNSYTKVYRPLTIASFALDWKISRGLAPVFHAENVVLHLVAALLVYVLIQRLFKSSPQGRAIAFATALLFAVHPIHTEAVASISGRAELLAAIFLIAAWTLHMKGREIPALFCFGLALLSKESAVVFLPLVVLGDYLLEWKPAGRYARIAGMTALYLFVLWKVDGNRFGPGNITPLDNALTILPAGPRIANALAIGWKYVWLQIYPITLSADYSYNQIPLLFWTRLIPVLLLAVFVFGVWWWALRSKNQGIALAAGIYIIGFGATSNVVMPIGTIMAERLAYFPSIGMCVLASLGLVWLRQRVPRVATGLLAAIIVLFSCRTIVRNRDWKDNRTLYAATLRSAPNSAKAHHNMALEYMDARQFGPARKEFETAIQIYPYDPKALATFGLLEFWQGNYPQAGRLMEKAYSLVDRSNPAYDVIVVNLASLYIETNHIDGAIALLDKEIAESPKYGPAWANRALAHYKLGKKSAARADVEVALKLDPTNQQAQNVAKLLD